MRLLLKFAWWTYGIVAALYFYVVLLIVFDFWFDPSTYSGIALGILVLPWSLLEPWRGASPGFIATFAVVEALANCALTFLLLKAVFRWIQRESSKNEWESCDSPLDSNIDPGRKNATQYIDS